jgi:hypothetical protein
MSLKTAIVPKKYEVLTAVTTKCTIFWDVTPCAFDMFQRKILHPPSGLKSKVTKHFAGSLFCSLFDTENGSITFLPNVD